MKIDFDTMRCNCIEIYDQTSRLIKLGRQLGIDLALPFESAEQLSSDPSTKSWDGMGRWAKNLVDNTTMWDKLPNTYTLTIDVAYKGQKMEWNKAEAQASLIDCFKQLGGQQLFNIQTTQS